MNAYDLQIISVSKSIALLLFWPLECLLNIYIGEFDTPCYNIAQHKAWRLSVAFTSRRFHQIDFPRFRSLFARLIMRAIISALQIMYPGAH